jgi:hypothetical protein
MTLDTDRFAVGYNAFILLATFCQASFFPPCFVPYGKIARTSIARKWDRDQFL